MALEIELKAWVSDPDCLREVLTARAGPGVPYDKQDTYYRAPESAGAFEFRIRRSGSGAVLTRKEKRIERGLEMNREQECSIGDPDQLDALVRELGCTVFARKRKRGWAFTVDGLTVELSDVEGLGWFVEIEALVDDGERRPEVETAIRALLSKLGIPQSFIEPVPYTTMLADPTAAQSRPEAVGRQPTDGAPA